MNIKRTNSNNFLELVGILLAATVTRFSNSPPNILHNQWQLMTFIELLNRKRINKTTTQDEKQTLQIWKFNMFF